MSFLDTSCLSFAWNAAPLRSSVRPEAGCAQCGSRLELNDGGKYDVSGKCFSCMNWVSDEDEEQYELED